MILVDTNILGRITDSADSQCKICRKAINSLRARDEQLIIFPQNLYDFWAIATRPRGAPPVGQNGLGMKIEQARQWEEFFIRRFIVLADRPELAQTWLSLVAAHRVGGYRSHDVRLAAAMQTYGIRTILTLNPRDFESMGVTILDPSSI